MTINNSEGTRERAACKGMSKAVQKANAVVLSLMWWWFHPKFGRLGECLCEVRDGRCGVEKEERFSLPSERESGSGKYATEECRVHEDILYPRLSTSLSARH